MKVPQILEMLHKAGWCVQAFSEANQGTACGLAIPDFPLARGYGSIDYLLSIDGKAVGLIEIISEVDPLCGIPVDSEKYRRGLPFSLRLYTRPLPFLYQTNGHEICFTNAFDPEPAPRMLHGIHQTETLQSWIEDGAVGETPRDMAAAYFPEHRRRGRTFHERVLINMPDLEIKGLPDSSIKTVQTLEDFLKLDRRDILIEILAGSESRRAMGVFVDRLIRFVDAKRILILVDHEKEIDALVNLFSASFCIQILNKENTIDLNARLCITTVKAFDHLMKDGVRESLPIETFEVIVLDECSASASNIKYFDAYLVGFFERANQEIRELFNAYVFAHNQQTDGLNVISGITE